MKASNSEEEVGKKRKENSTVNNKKKLHLNANKVNGESESKPVQNAARSPSDYSAPESEVSKSIQEPLSFHFLPKLKHCSTGHKTPCVPFEGQVSNWSKSEWRNIVEQKVIVNGKSMLRK